MNTAIRSCVAGPSRHGLERCASTLQGPSQEVGDEQAFKGSSQRRNATALIKRGSRQRLEWRREEGEEERRPPKRSQASLPRLRPDSFSFLGPLPSSEVLRHTTPQSRAFVLAKLEAAIAAKPADPDQVYDALQAILRLPTGVTLLSPSDLQRLIRVFADPRGPRIGIRESLTRVKSLIRTIEGAIQAYEEQGNQSKELVEWSQVLGSLETQRSLLLLVTKSLRSPSREEARLAIELLVSRGLKEPEGELPRPDALSCNLLLDVLARAASVKGRPSKGKDRQEHLEESSPAYALYTALSQSRSNLKFRKLADADSLFNNVWSVMANSNDSTLQPDAFSYSSKLLIEQKKAARDVLWALSTITRRQSEDRRGGDLQGWSRVQAVLKEMAEKKLLTTAQINQAMKQLTNYQRFARIAIARITEQTTNSEDDAGQKLVQEFSRTSFTEDSGSDDIRAVTIANIKRFALLEDPSGDYLQEAYDGLRWNEMEETMEELQSKSGRPKRTKYPWDVFGFFDEKRKSEQANEGAGQTGKEPGDSWSTAPAIRPPLTLLGFPLPADLVTDDYTFGTLVRHYANGVPSYKKMQDVIEDFRQSGPVGGKPSVDGSPSYMRKLTLPIFDWIFMGFAKNGVPSTWNAQDQRWELHPSVDSTSAAAQWNITNYLQYLEELLEMEPPSLTHRRSQQANDQDLYRSFYESSSPSEEAAKHFLQQHRRRSASVGPDELIARTPTGQQIFFVLTALRRCMGDEHTRLVLNYWNRILCKFDPSVLPSKPTHPMSSSSTKRRTKSATSSSKEAATPRQDHQQTEAEPSGLRSDRLSPYPSEVARFDLERPKWKGWAIDARLKRLLPFLMDKAAAQEKQMGKGQ